MSIFDAYDNSTKAVYDDVGGRSGDRIYPDCEADYLVEVVGLSSGKSKNKKNSKRNGQSFAAGELRVVKINSLGKGSESTRIKEGTCVSWHVWLPRDPDPENMSLEDKYNLAEAMQFGASLLGLRGEFCTTQLLSQIFADDGRKVAKRRLGLSVSPSTGTDSNGKEVTYYNPSFYPVDADGARVVGKTPDELKAA